LRGKKKSMKKKGKEKARHTNSMTNKGVGKSSGYVCERGNELRAKQREESTEVLREADFNDERGGKRSGPTTARDQCRRLFVWSVVAKRKSRGRIADG